MKGKVRCVSVLLVVLSLALQGLATAPAAVYGSGSPEPPSGRVVAWGSSETGPVTPPTKAMDGVTAIAAGSFHSLALKDGEVLAWGCRDALPGDLAYTGECTVPADAQTGVTAIAGGLFHSMALKNGGVIAWGQGDVSVPPEANSGIVAIASGASHRMALTSDGRVLAWGSNSVGQTDVPMDATAGVAAIATGWLHSLAVKDGKVLAWGCGDGNAFGQCAVPDKALGGGTTAVSAGVAHSLALVNGEVVAWGCGGGQDVGQCTVPPAAQSGVTAIAAGGYHSLALKDGVVIAWGNFWHGELNVPSELQGHAVAIAGGNYHNLAIQGLPKYDFGGFTAPVVPLPGLNKAKAGSTIPVKFSLGGDQGLDIFASGYPVSNAVTCPGLAATGEVPETTQQDLSRLIYDPAANQYVYLWRTNPDWAGQCRRLDLKLTNGQTHSANFSFVR
ncbi:MAG: PxKF domain-containing protein [Chloroflexota bacterium]